MFERDTWARVVTSRYRTMAELLQCADKSCKSFRQQDFHTTVLTTCEATSFTDHSASYRLLASHIRSQNIARTLVVFWL